MNDSKKFWFSAKRYGYGWGWPNAWQGWLSVIAGALVFALGKHFFPPGESLLAFVAVMFVPALVFGGICLAKAEPPRWRWGKKSR